jgi:hypothetical protein
MATLIVWNENPIPARTISSLKQCPTIKAVAAAAPSGADTPPAADITTIRVAGLWSKQAICDGLKWFTTTGTDNLLVITTGSLAPVVNTEGLHRMQTCLNDTDASIVYGDYFDTLPDGSMRLHQLIDYQKGSIRDTFDFGPAILINGRFIDDIRRAIVASSQDFAFGGLYDLRLRLSERSPVCRLPEPLYYCVNTTDAAHNSGHFAYVDPRNRDYQIEMEKIATAHLQRIGASIAAPECAPLSSDGSFPVKASVIIPVKNRHRTISDAVKSALSQVTAFSYNIIVVDNHSTDGTTDILAEIARTDARLVHLVPERTDLLIGGCWNEAIYSEACGEYAVQLDSDDLYDGNGVLTRIVAEFDKKPYALVIGSYTTVNFDLKPLAPGLIDHREWTDANGMNNALRIAGLGAPRAYHVPTLRTCGFPNVSYGEDYAAVLRLSRSYPVGRIYDSLYWCRRWDENSDSMLAPETANRYDLYKDRLRSIEIAARIRRDACR